MSKEEIADILRQRILELDLEKSIGLHPCMINDNFKIIEVPDNFFPTNINCPDNLTNNRYILQIHPPLGHGGAGNAYKGFDQKMAQMIVGKKLNMRQYLPNEADRRELIQKAYKETLTMAEIDHPNIVKPIDIASDGHELYIIQEFVEGETLQERIDNKENGFRPGDILPILKDITSAVDFMDKKGIIHRDLKPQNIFYDEKNKGYKIGDFGTARGNKYDLAVSEEIPPTGGKEILGTPRFMAPEIFDGTENNIASEVYSIGIIAYNMLSNRFPYNANSNLELIRKLMSDSEQPTELSDYIAGEFTELSKVVMKAISKDPNERYNTATEFYEAFREGYLKTII